MTREERLALIEKLKAEIEVGTAEVALSRQQRELDGIYDPLPTATVNKSMDDSRLVFKTNHQALQPRPQQRIATLKNLQHLSSTVGSRLGQELTKIDTTTEELRSQIEELRGEVNLLRSLIKGEIKQIGGRRVA